MKLQVGGQCSRINDFSISGGVSWQSQYWFGYLIFNSLPGLNCLILSCAVLWVGIPIWWKSGNCPLNSHHGGRDKSGLVWELDEAAIHLTGSRKWNDGYLWRWLGSSIEIMYLIKPLFINIWLRLIPSINLAKLSWGWFWLCSCKFDFLFIEVILLYSIKVARPLAECWINSINIPAIPGRNSVPQQLQDHLLEKY